MTRTTKPGRRLFQQKLILAVAWACRLDGPGQGAPKSKGTGKRGDRFLHSRALLLQRLLGKVLGNKEEKKSLKSAVAVTSKTTGGRMNSNNSNNNKGNSISATRFRPARTDQSGCALPVIRHRHMLTISARARLRKEEERMDD
ncbi:hypothetical protein IF1G_07781 [Cordyceps javanica]|uniref:Uncharacterized protein n=1 Tax=Cordyceps javanica TaxID=43265 RepID=A0A545UUQ5_9HYPO|nr:hypothetical protein IF1G_07781 [Cordyceps javanica]